MESSFEITFVAVVYVLSLVIGAWIILGKRDHDG